MNERYGAPDIIITENGVDVPNENAAPYSTSDQFRISYIEGYLEQVKSHTAHYSQARFDLHMYAYGWFFAVMAVQVVVIPFSHYHPYLQ